MPPMLTRLSLTVTALLAISIGIPNAVAHPAIEEQIEIACTLDPDLRDIGR